jgi:hypothetical protein
MKLKPCPFCGNQNLLAGPHSADSQGVECMYMTMIDGTCYVKGCRATISCRLPNYWPKGVDGLKQLEEWTLNKAIKKWNKRV